jgi:hypothetical protein
MNETRIRSILKKGEGIAVEFKPIAGTIRSF